MKKKVMLLIASGFGMFLAAWLGVVTFRMIEEYVFIAHDQYMPPLESFPQLRTNAPATTVTQSRALVLSLAIFCARISIVVLCHL